MIENKEQIKSPEIPAFCLGDPCEYPQCDCFPSKASAPKEKHSEGPTPRTDAATKKNFESEGVTVWDYEEMRQHACDLERELSDAYQVVDDNWVTHQRVIAAEKAAQSAIPASADTQLLDAFEKVDGAVYYTKNEYRGKKESGWTYWTMFGEEGPQVWPTAREAMRECVDDPDTDKLGAPLSSTGAGKGQGLPDYPLSLVPGCRWPECDCKGRWECSAALDGAASDKGP